MLRFWSFPKIGWLYDMPNQWWVWFHPHEGLRKSCSHLCWVHGEGSVDSKHWRLCKWIWIKGICDQVLKARNVRSYTSVFDLGAVGSITSSSNLLVEEQNLESENWIWVYLSVSEPVFPLLTKYGKQKNLNFLSQNNTWVVPIEFQKICEGAFYVFPINEIYDNGF